MSTRSNGRPTPGRGARVERRKEARTAVGGGAHRMTVPDHLACLAGHAEERIARRPPCPIDPACTVNHLNRKAAARA